MGMLALLSAFGLTASALTPRPAWRLALVAAALNVAFAGLLTAYVFRTELAFSDRTAWNLRVNAGERTLYVAVMALVAFSVLVFGLLALRRTRGWPLRSAVLVSGGVEVVLGWLVFIAFEID